MTEKSLEERLATLERKVEELEKRLAEKPSIETVRSEINYQMKSVARKSATGRIR